MATIIGKVPALRLHANRAYIAGRVLTWPEKLEITATAAAINRSREVICSTEQVVLTPQIAQWPATD